jgi:molybdopterin-guanine dinucleotide biosynthesis protein A
MGQDKALLLFDGTTLVERALEKMKAVCASVAIAGGTEALTGFGRVVRDRLPGCGPLGGIVAALEWSESEASRSEASEFEWSLFLPVDVPLLTVDFLLELGQRCLESSAIAVMPRINGRVEPICAGYNRRALPGLRQALEAGRFKVTAAAEAAGRVDYMEIVDAAAMFANVNTPAEFAEAERFLMLPDAGSI